MEMIWCVNLQLIFFVPACLSQYIVDSSSTRHIIDIGKSKKENYSKGGNKFVFTAPKIDIAGAYRVGSHHRALLSSSVGRLSEVLMSAVPSINAFMHVVLALFLFLFCLSRDARLLHYACMRARRSENAIAQRRFAAGHPF